MSPSTPPGLHSSGSSDAPADCHPSPVDESLIAGLHMEMIGVGWVHAFQCIFGNTAWLSRIEEVN
jgi:hypothetical protein